MEVAVELNCRHQAKIQYPCCCLPQHLHQAYPIEVPVFLLDRKNILPGALLREVTLTEGGLDNNDNLLS